MCQPLDVPSSSKLARTVVPVIYAPAVEDVSRDVANQVLQSLRTLPHATKRVGWKAARKGLRMWLALDVLLLRDGNTDYCRE